MGVDHVNLDELESLIKDSGNKEHEASLLIDTNRIKLLTRLSKEEVTDISTLYYVAEMLELEEFSNLLDNLVTFKVSEGGKGRKEIENVLKGQRQTMQPFGFGGGGNGFNR